MTSTSEELNINMNYFININSKDKLKEFNITMEFSETDIYMNSLFYGLKDIKKVDLSNYNIKPTDTSFLFSECTNLEEIIFGDFDTSNVKDMYAMFQKSNIKRLDLSKFVTNNVTNMDYMFDSCQNLEYLDIRNFDFSKTIGCPNIFNGCEDSLKYLNIYSYKDGNIFENSLFFDNANNDLICCINIETSPSFSSKLIDKGYIIDCSYFPNQESSVSPTYKITYSKINITNYIPKIKTELNELNYNVDTIKTIDECTSEEIFLKKCGGIINQTLSIENKDNLITNIKNDIINGNLNIILNNIINGDEDDYIIKEDDIIFQLTTTENQNINEYNNISSIKLGNCEEILRNTYNISYNISLIILKVDYFIKEYNIPIIGYEIFHPITKEKLNISICYNTTIIYNIPVDINEKELDKYNISSDYYNDECSIYTTEDGTDIIISDRKQEYNDNNMFLCENNCQYTNYNISSKKSICNCEIKLKIYSISEIIY
jgi:surface protein